MNKIKRIVKKVKTLLKRDGPDFAKQIASFQIGGNNLSNREEWLERTLASIPAGSKILDAGAGELQYKKFCNHLNYTSQDFAQYNGSGNNVGLQTGTWDNSKLDIISDIINMPIEDSSFDAIMCIEVFEHIPTPNLAVKEFARVLKKGGTVIITSPFCSLTHFAPYYFANGFSKYWYQTILEQYGFKIKEITPNGSYFEYIAQELKRVPEVAKLFSGETDELYKRYSPALIKMLEFLTEFKEKDKGSNELLCFGYHVVAEKI